MSVELLKETIERELPGLLRDDPALRAYVLELTRREWPAADLRVEILHRQGGDVHFRVQGAVFEQHHQRTANRLIVIAPTIDARARKVAERLGIETYGDSTEVEAL